MDQSYTENDISLSPSQILERLHMLRQLQLMQRGKLQKQQLQYQETSDSSSCITEMISHFTNSVNSTSYNTFRSLLQSPHDVQNDGSPLHNTSNMSQKVRDKDLIEGISILNLSQESELIVNTPTSGRSKASAHSKTQELSPQCAENIFLNTEPSQVKNKPISLDEMPVLTPKKDFESMVIEKLQCDKNTVQAKSCQKDSALTQKKPFLRRGEGMTRFGLRKKDLVIQNTKSLPWKKKIKELKTMQSLKNTKPKSLEKGVDDHKSIVDIVIPPLKLNVNWRNEHKVMESTVHYACDQIESNTSTALTVNSKLSPDNSTSKSSNHSENKIIQFPIGKHPILTNKGKTWASVLTNEQNDFLKQLKQSDYYKNYGSPAKSIVSDMSCDENTSKLKQELESAEQNMFELLENKVSRESFNLENSFFNRFLRKSHLENSGESTPVIMQKCLANNLNLMHIFPDTNHQPKKGIYNDTGICQSEYTECCSDSCSSVSSCCSCKTVEPATPQNCKKDIRKVSNKNEGKEVQNKTDQNEKKCQNEVDKETEIMKANMVEMNTKLINTSELLKDRLQELEDEIETFRKENMNLNKMKEEIDIQRQKFYEEKNTFEQKFNEEKILSEYYLAEEKEKLNKQKQMYERYVREMRGRLSKKDKDEVANLKQEISSLKEEIRIKDAKTTSTIARLRNQLKIMDKEKSELQNQVDKLKKENRRIQHSNDITRRLTNMKYLEQINKKLSNMNKEPQSEVVLNGDVKYKAFEIERQSRSKKAQVAAKDTLRPRAKSVPNLKVTSRYAKYFSQRDAISQRNENATLNVEGLDIPYDSDDDQLITNNGIAYSDDNGSNFGNHNSYSDNNLEQIYMETFRSSSPTVNSSSNIDNLDNNCLSEYNSSSISNGFFLRKSNSSSSTTDSKSPVNILTTQYEKSLLKRSKSPVSIVSYRTSLKSPVSHNSEKKTVESNNTERSNSPVSVSNHSSQKSTTVIHKDVYQDKLAVSPEPSSTKSSSRKTSLNPTEYRKADGSRELRFPNGNVKYISPDGKYCKFVYYNGDVKENFYNDGRIKYYYADSKTYHTTHADGLEVLEFPDGQVEKRYKDGSSEVRLPNGSIRYHDPKNEHVREEWRFPDGSALTVSANGERRIAFANGQIEVHADDHKRREFPDGTVKLVYNDGTSETRYASGRVRIKDKHGHLIMDSAPG